MTSIPARLAPLAAVLLVAGCAAPGSGERNPSPPTAPPAPAVVAGLDQAQRYWTDFARSSPAQRAAECRKMRQGQRRDQGFELKLRLLLARSAVPGCGELPGAAAINGLLAGADDARLRDFLIYHKAILARLGRLEQAAERRKALEKQLSDNRSKADRTSRRLRSREGELRDLQKKLEALKAIEDSLDAPDDGH